MATYNKFQAFVDDVNEGKHVMATNQLTVALTNVAPVATNAVLADLTEISYTNISSRNITTTSSTQTAGTYRLIVQDLVLTASAVVPTFRYVAVYNSTAVAGPLISWFDNGSAVDLVASETFTIDFDQVNGLYSMT